MVFLTSIASRLWSLQPPLLTKVLLTSVARQRPFRPPSPTKYSPYNLICRLWSFRPPSPENGLSDLRRLQIMPTTVFLTSVAHRLWSLRPPLPIIVLLTFVARQQSFQPLLLADNDLFDLHRPLTPVLPTSITRQQSFRPSSPTDNGRSDLRCPPTMIWKMNRECETDQIYDSTDKDIILSNLNSGCRPLSPPLSQPSIYLPKAFHYKTDPNLMAMLPLATPHKSLLNKNSTHNESQIPQPHHDLPFGIQSLPPFRITQTNGCFDASNPSAISLSCSIEKRLKLPKQMYTTELVGLLSSHFKHSLTDAGYSPPLVDLSITSLLHRETGPTFHTLPILSRPGRTKDSTLSAGRRRCWKALLAQAKKLLPPEKTIRKIPLAIATSYVHGKNKSVTTQSGLRSLSTESKGWRSEAIALEKKNEGVVLAPIREAEFGSGKRDYVEMNRVIDIGADNGGINGSSEDGDAGTTGGEDLGHVDHREHEGGVDADPASLRSASNGVEVNRAKGDCLAVPEAGVLSPIFDGKSGTLECSLPSPVLPKIAICVDEDGFPNKNIYCINLNASHLCVDDVANSGDLSIVVGSRVVVPSREALPDSPIHALVGNVVSSPLESVVRDAVKGNAEYVDIPILVMTNGELKDHLARSLNNSVLLDMDDDLSVHVNDDMSNLKVGFVDQAVLNGGGKGVISLDFSFSFNVVGFSGVLDYDEVASCLSLCSPGLVGNLGDKPFMLGGNLCGLYAEDDFDWLSPMDGQCLTSGWLQGAASPESVIIREISILLTGSL
ncbi:hypothetical protein M5K25_008022 [Dendrobium thyrsiflorum]|uniref:Uncharacterized protein n=1 Tax=Dendrobium thyrsiflorum TaxID=117978 RepID=A0ABD0V7P0_DENTH